MKKRAFGRTGWQVAPIGFGAWAIGADWGDVPDRDAEATVNEALDRGVDFIDTADVYGMGRSEKLIAKVLKARVGQGKSGKRDVVVATKAGRKLQPHVASGYTIQAITGFIEQSLRNLELEALDILQLHCPPSEVYRNRELFAGLDRLVTAGKLKHYGVSVQDVAEAIKAMDYDIASVQIIFNIFRQKPAETFFDLAKRKQGAKNPKQAADNVAAGALPPLTAEQMAAIRRIYDAEIKPLVHHRW